RATQADVVDGETYLPYLESRPVYFFGNGSDKCRDVLSHPNARFISDIHPLAKWMMPLAERNMRNEEFENVAYFVPFYLKDFVAKQPKKLI
ncbi:MAG: tRNA (adenosine(37)-N6)-threonylcarbamoyltransferase complex dimerization subunit type 1 TsaB, partial [Prevotella sp.]|nr:tRNA (adenosine(37)-N6)-threonylcarbamoyltransferase complex dimerization subunit type 1 TsaB [Prevotella sp.]